MNEVRILRVEIWSHRLRNDVVVLVNKQHHDPWSALQSIRRKTCMVLVPASMELTAAETAAGAESTAAGGGGWVGDTAENRVAGEIADDDVDAVDGHEDDSAYDAANGVAFAAAAEIVASVAAAAAVVAPPPAPAAVEVAAAAVRVAADPGEGVTIHNNHHRQDDFVNPRPFQRQNSADAVTRKKQNLPERLKKN
jgi:hypothetical protein